MDVKRSIVNWDPSLAIVGVEHRHTPTGGLGRRNSPAARQVVATATRLDALSLLSVQPIFYTLHPRSIPSSVPDSHAFEPIEMSSPVHLNSNFQGVTIVGGSLTCSCGLVMAQRPNDKPKCKMPFLFESEYTNLRSLLMPQGVSTRPVQKQDMA
jgi:hypothetical protein